MIEAGTVVLIGHGAVGGSEALFMMGVGDTASIMDKGEVAHGLMDGFLTKAGALLGLPQARGHLEST